MTLAAEVIERMAARGLTLATAEASVGGLIGHLLTDVLGASRVFLGGVAPYVNTAKVAVLHVPPDVLKRHGSVSEQAVLAMAHGAREVMRADVGIAETGVASETGNHERPAGMYWVAIVADEVERVVRYQFADDRAGNKQQAAEAALRLVLEYLDRPLDNGDETR